MLCFGGFGGFGGKCFHSLLPSDIDFKHALDIQCVCVCACVCDVCVCVCVCIRACIYVDVFLNHCCFSPSFLPFLPFLFFIILCV